MCGIEHTPRNFWLWRVVAIIRSRFFLLNARLVAISFHAGKKEYRFFVSSPAIKRPIMLLLELESGLMIRKPISVKDFAWENPILPPLTVLHVHNIDKSAHFEKMAWARPPRPRAA